MINKYRKGAAIHIATLFRLMLSVEGSFDARLFRDLSNNVFRSRYLWKCLKFNIDFEKGKKIQKEIFGCEIIGSELVGSVKLSLLSR